MAGQTNSRTRFAKIKPKSSICVNAGILKANEVAILKPENSFKTTRLLERIKRRPLRIKLRFHTKRHQVKPEEDHQGYSKKSVEDVKTVTLCTTDDYSKEISKPASENGAACGAGIADTMQLRQKRKYGVNKEQTETRKLKRIKALLGDEKLRSVAHLLWKSEQGNQTRLAAGDAVVEDGWAQIKPEQKLPYYSRAQRLQKPVVPPKSQQKRVIKQQTTTEERPAGVLFRLCITSLIVKSVDENQKTIPSNRENDIKPVHSVLCEQEFMKLTTRAQNTYLSNQLLNLQRMLSPSDYNRFLDDLLRGCQLAHASLQSGHRRHSAPQDQMLRRVMFLRLLSVLPRVRERQRHRAVLRHKQLARQLEDLVLRTLRGDDVTYETHYRCRDLDVLIDVIGSSAIKEERLLDAADEDSSRETMSVIKTYLHASNKHALVIGGETVHVPRITEDLMEKRVLQQTLSTQNLPELCCSDIEHTLKQSGPVTSPGQASWQEVMLAGASDMVQRARHGLQPCCELSQPTCVLATLIAVERVSAEAAAENTEEL